MNGATDGAHHDALNGPGPPEPLAARQVPLPVVLDLAAVRVRALMAAIAQQQAGWVLQQADPNQKQLLLLACTVCLELGHCRKMATSLNVPVLYGREGGRTLI